MHTEQLTLGGGEPIFTWYRAEIHRKRPRMTLQAGLLATRWLIPKTAVYHRASVDGADKATAALTTQLSLRALFLACPSLFALYNISTFGQGSSLPALPARPRR